MRGLSDAQRQALTDLAMYRGETPPPTTWVVTDGLDLIVRGAVEENGRKGYWLMCNNGAGLVPCGITPLGRLALRADAAAREKGLWPISR